MKRQILPTVIYLKFRNLIIHNAVEFVTTSSHIL